MLVLCWTCFFFKKLNYSSDNPVMNAVHSNMSGKIPLTKSVYQGQCTLCNVNFTSIAIEQAHNSGKKHLKKVHQQSGLYGFFS